MIYTITLNPAIDYVLPVADFKLGETNRSQGEQFVAGGKGINVARVLHNLGLPAVVLGFVAGFTGEFIREQLHTEGLEEHLITVTTSHNAYSRVNVKLKAEEETEINAGGPEITARDWQELLSQLARLNSSDFVVMSGSSGKAPHDAYAQIGELLSRKNIPWIADTTGASLKEALQYKPVLVKPNRAELEEFFSTSCSSIAEVEQLAGKLQQLGAQNVVVSLGGEGAIYVGKDQSGHVLAPQGKVINSVGAGDSLVAGFLTAYLQGMSLQDAVRYGVCCGSATAFSTGFADKKTVNALWQ